MASRTIDTRSPATMITKTIGSILGCAGMALLGFGTLCLMKIMIDTILLMIPAIINGQNPFSFVLNGVTWQTFFCQIICVIVGVVSKKLASWLCSKPIQKSINEFFYGKSDKD